MSLYIEWEWNKKLNQKKEDQGKKPNCERSLGNICHKYLMFLLGLLVSSLKSHIRDMGERLIAKGKDKKRNNLLKYFQRELRLAEWEGILKSWLEEFPSWRSG